MPTGTYRAALCFGMWLGLAAGTASADQLFSVTATGTSSTASASGSSVINLVDDLSNNNGAFTALKNQNYSAALNYAGIKNAVTLGQTFDQQGHRIVTVSVPSVGITRTFNSADGSITSQVRDFLKSDGLSALTSFQAIVNRTSPVGSVDGNPMAATALLTDAGYFQFAQQRGEGQINGRFTTADGHGQSLIWVSGGAVDAGGISGSYVDLNIASQYQFNDVIALSLDAPGRWLKLRNSNVFMGGVLLGLPIGIIPGNREQGLSWHLTPAGQAGAVGSADFASGALIYGGQLSSSLDYSTHGLTFTIADTAAYFHGADISIAGYDFNTRLDQWVFKNGVQVSKAWAGLVLDVGASWTNFLHGTYMDGYLSPEAGVAIRFGKHHNSGLRVGYVGNFGQGYNTNGGNILLYVTH